MNGRKTSAAMNRRAKATKFESTPVRLPLINPNEKAQMTETTSKVNIKLFQILLFYRGNHNTYMNQQKPSFLPGNCQQKEA
jgi:hypothetical protein